MRVRFLLSLIKRKKKFRLFLPIKIKYLLKKKTNTYVFFSNSQYFNLNPSLNLNLLFNLNLFFKITLLSTLVSYLNYFNYNKIFFLNKNFNLFFFNHQLKRDYFSNVSYFSDNKFLSNFWNFLKKPLFFSKKTKKKQKKNKKILKFLFYKNFFFIKISFLNFYFYSKTIYAALNFFKKSYCGLYYDIGLFTFYDVIRFNHIVMNRTHINLNRFLLLKIFKFFFNKKLLKLNLFNKLIANNFKFFKKHTLVSFSSGIILKNFFSANKISNFSFFLKNSNFFFNFFFNFKCLKFFLYWNNLYYYQHFFFSYFKNFFINPNFFHLNNNNFFINSNFKLIFKKKLTKIFSYKKFSNVLTPWQANSILKFMEFYSGSKIMIKFFFFLNFILTKQEYARCLVWSQHLKFFQKFVGRGFFLFDAVQIMYTALKLKDPFFLINWMTYVLNRISFWKLRAFFHFLQYIYKNCFGPLFEKLGLKGIKFQLKGKVGVAGNARTRYITSFYGVTGAATYDDKVLYSLSLIKTFTGVMGLKIWLVF